MSKDIQLTKKELAYIIKTQDEDICQLQKLIEHLRQNVLMVGLNIDRAWLDKVQKMREFVSLN